MPKTCTQCHWLCCNLLTIPDGWSTGPFAWVRLQKYVRHQWAAHSSSSICSLSYTCAAANNRISAPAGKREKNWLVFFSSSSSSLQKLQENTTSCQRPTHDRKRKFIKSDLALDTEGRQRAEGEVNFTASKHLAKFNWFVATCAANYRISITTQRPVMTLTSLCQWSETQIDLLLAAHVPSELQWLWQHISSP